jgi:hypothetical protein
MKKENHTTTAANSNTMNAVENAKLFAAAGDSEPGISFRDADNDLWKTDPSGNKAVLINRRRQINNSPHRK